MKYVALLVLAAIPVFSQTAREVDLTWTATASASQVPITSYNLSRMDNNSGTFLPIAGLPGTQTSYADMAPLVGSTIQYQLTASAAPCTPTSTLPCGTSGPSVSNIVVVPPFPQAIATICMTAPGGPTTFQLTVVSGTGSGTYAAGATVSIQANIVTGQTFSGWTPASLVANSSSVSTTLVMPGSATTVTANYTNNPPPPPPTQITFVQVNSATPQNKAGGSTISISYTKAQANGDLNVIVVGWNDSTATVFSVTDTMGNTYIRAVGPTVQSGLATQSIYYAPAVKAAGANGNTVRVAFNVAPQAPDIRILEYSGASLTSPVDSVAAAQSLSSGTASSGNLSTTTANDLIFGADLTQRETTGVGSGFTRRVLTAPDSDVAEDKLVGAPGTYAATVTVTGQWIMQAVAFH